MHFFCIDWIGNLRAVFSNIQRKDDQGFQSCPNSCKIRQKKILYMLYIPIDIWWIFTLLNDNSVSDSLLLDQQNGWETVLNLYSVGFTKNLTENWIIFIPSSCLIRERHAWLETNMPVWRLTCLIGDQHAWSETDMSYQKSTFLIEDPSQIDRLNISPL